MPRLSDELTGKPVAEFRAATLDGRTVTTADFGGAPLVVNFFASWCPVCQMEIAHLREMAPEFAARGIKTFGVLVDPLETPDTEPDARAELARNPLPWTVLLMNPSLRDAFHYDGFPATYFVTADGLFSTTLLGYHPKERLQEVAARLAPGAPAPAASAASGPHHEWEKQPLRALLPGRWQEWHPMIVHFPVALLVIEAGALALVGWSDAAARASSWLLWLAVLALLPTVYTGIVDDGASVGPGSAFWNGVHDRARHLFRLESSISVHVLFVLAVVGVTLARLAWRTWAGDRVLRGWHRLAFDAATLLGLWLLFGAAQVGGGISHP